MPFFAGTRVVSLLYVTQFETGVEVLVAEVWGTAVGVGVAFWAGMDSGGIGVEAEIGDCCGPR